MANLVRDGKLLGIDYGTKKIGIALSDDKQTFAFPHSVVENSSEFITFIHSLAVREGVSGIVMGKSLDYHGKENPVMEDIRRNAKKIEEMTDLPVFFEPEVLTTAEAKRHASDSKGSARKSMLDASAAALILQSYLDRHHE